MAVETAVVPDNDPGEKPESGGRQPVPTPGARACPGGDPEHAGYGRFITFEGMDGSGKSTQIAFLKQKLENRGFQVVTLREPGGTAIGDRIRDILLDTGFSEMEPVTEMLLYAASRAELVRKKIRPSLKAGYIVLCDRYVDSSIAYQGAGRSLGDLVKDVNRCAVDGVIPDLTFFIDVSPEEGRSRIEEEREPDRMEREDISFRQRVYEGFLKEAAASPGRFVRIDGLMTPEEISSEVLRICGERLGL